MPDITMCKGIDCPLADRCYRHTATPNEYRQSYFLGSPKKEDEDTCKHFWPTQEENK